MNSDVLERMLPGYSWPSFCDLIAANPLAGYVAPPGEDICEIRILDPLPLG
jgi:hypothetical protein